VVKVATGKSHSLFLLDSGEVYACGAATCGQLGLGAGKRSQEDALLPVAVTALSDVRDIACGAEFSLVCTRESGQVLTFGHPEVQYSTCMLRYAAHCFIHSLTHRLALLFSCSLV
jgi:alpha-tubulin suppressor-like RCC1 family protein